MIIKIRTALLIAKNMGYALTQYTNKLKLYIFIYINCLCYTLLRSFFGLKNTCSCPESKESKDVTSLLHPKFFACIITRLNSGSQRKLGHYALDFSQLAITINNTQIVKFLDGHTN